MEKLKRIDTHHDNRNSAIGGILPKSIERNSLSMVFNSVVF